jgi:Tfp pilus assembly protein PilF
VAATIVIGVALAAGCGGNKAAKKSEELSPRKKELMAHSMMNANRVGEALRLIDEAVAADPDNPQMHASRGMILVRAGSFGEAEGSFHKVLELDPYHTDAHNFLGVIYNELGRKGEAEEHYRIALADPAYASREKVHFNLGLLYASQGMNEEAIDSFRTAVEIDPKYYRAHYELASILDRIDKTTEAVAEYEVARPAFDGVSEFHYRLGLAYYRLGESQKARECLTRVISLSPGSKSAVQADEMLKVIE